MSIYYSFNGQPLWSVACRTFENPFRPFKIIKIWAMFECITAIVDVLPDPVLSSMYLFCSMNPHGKPLR